ncbi:MAG: transketolase, partial [Coxiellaceae bacterium]|nr:transketolase [Coxiellaceae bacterium]
LEKLIVFYDDNGISIDGNVEGWFTDDTPKRFEAYNWQVIANVDGHDAEAIAAAIKAAKGDGKRPTLICCKTQIGFGSPNKANTADAHGAPLGDDEIAKTREALGWKEAPFVIPDEIYQAWDKREVGQALENDWNKLFAKYESAHPELAREFLRRLHNDKPSDWAEKSNAFIQACQRKTDAVATRKASLLALNAYAPSLPEMLGGSADLTGSNCTATAESKIITHDDFSGNYIEYGVREFAMAAIMNGLALHRGIIPFAGTFLVFSDYARNAIRLSALMGLRVVHVLTHDSIGLGEDGPTHQPIEHAASLRLMPNLNVWRPCDLTETAVAWQSAVETSGPSALLLSRQNLPHEERSSEAVANIARGGYVLKDSGDFPDGIFIATGSEVQLAMEAAQALSVEGVDIRVVSMPCIELFKQQDAEYRESVLPKAVKARVAIEAGVPDSWYQFVGASGAIVGIERFGKSAPAEKVFVDLGVTAEHAKQVMQTLLHESKVQSMS